MKKLFNEFKVGLFLVIILMAHYLLDLSRYSL